MILNITTRVDLYPVKVAGCIDFALIISKEKYEISDPPKVSSFFTHQRNAVDH